MLDKLSQASSLAVLNKLAQALKKQPQNALISALQAHQSFICQSENLEDYLNECKKMIGVVFNQPDNERLTDRLVAQLNLLARYGQLKAFDKSSNRVQYSSKLGRLHQKLAEYRGYLARFDDQIRSHANLTPQHSIYQRREKCQQAIESLEQQISQIEIRGRSR